MGCGCKKNKVQEVVVTPVQVSVTESKPQSDQSSINLTAEQKQQVNVIIEKINNLNSNQ